MFEKFRKPTNKNTLEILMNEQYNQQYFEECKYIWHNYVPKNGVSYVLQGELLRLIEKLRYEAQDNGNINWNEVYATYCDYIKETLCSKAIYSEEEKEKFVLIMDYLKECGNYAMRWNSGQISDSEVDMDKIAYTKNNLYDIIADAIGQFQAKFPNPIPIDKNGQTVIHIAEIPYETGEIHYRYARKKSPDGTKWIREGLFQEFYQNGNLASEGFYDEGLEEGAWKDYHENGNLAAEGNYSQGKETGKWRYYDENGNFEEEEDYD